VDPFTPAVELAAAIRTKEISPVEVADLYLERIDRLDTTLNAFCHRADDEVRGAAKRAADAVVTTPNAELPPFHGVPLPIKDLYDVAGWPSTRGSLATDPAPKAESDFIVDRFVAAGFVLLGMTNSPEFGAISFTESTAHGVTRNPWNPDHTPGGSSGGAGAAVASAMAPIAHASDGGGSIRIPSSCNGLVGLKPSRNRVPNGPNSMEGFSTSGVVSRTVADTAAVLDIIGRPDPLAWYNAPPPAEPFSVTAAKAPPKLRIGYTAAPPIDLDVAPSCVDAVNATVAALEGLGHHIEEVSLSMPHADAFIEAFGSVWNTGAADEPVVNWDLLEPVNAALHKAGLEMNSIRYVESVRKTQRLCRPLIAEFGTTFDILITPTMATEPPRCGSVWEGADEDPLMAMINCYPMGVFTSVWNVLGMPALSAPVHLADSGLPVGVQIVGGPWQDGLVLQVGAQLEQALPWRNRRAQVS
jgi:amidase